MEPLVSVPLSNGTHAEPVRLVLASTTMGMLAVPVMLKPKRFVFRPKLEPLVCACGFHSTAEGGLAQWSQPVFPGR